MAKELYTYLAKINSVVGSGYYALLSVEDYKGQKFKCYKGNLDDAKLKEWKGKWRFYNLQHLNNTLRYNRSMPCTPIIYDLMLLQYREKVKEEERSKQETIVSID